jgi:hypothetical protein
MEIMTAKFSQKTQMGSILGRQRPRQEQQATETDRPAEHLHNSPVTCSASKSSSLSAFCLVVHLTQVLDTALTLITQ